MRLTLNCIESSLIVRLPQAAARTASSQPSSLRLRSDACADEDAFVAAPGSTQLGHFCLRLTSDAKVGSDAGPIRFRAESDSAHDPAGGLSAFEKEMCLSQLSCISSVQRLARVRAASRKLGASIACNLSIRPGTALRESPAFESGRGENCSSVRSGRMTHTRFSSPSEEKKRGTTPRIVPSQSSSVPDFRDVTHFEWIVSQPSRRDSQCVPT